MIRRRKILDVLPRTRLLELARDFGIAGLTGKTKDEVAAAIADTRSLKTPELLGAFSRDELKAVCREAGHDDSGREKSTIIARLLGESVAHDAE